MQVCLIMCARPGNNSGAVDTICVCMSIEWLLLISCGLPVGCKHRVFQQDAPLNTSSRQ